MLDSEVGWNDSIPNFKDGTGTYRDVWSEGWSRSPFLSVGGTRSNRMMDYFHSVSLRLWVPYVSHPISSSPQHCSMARLPRVPSVPIQDGLGWPSSSWYCPCPLRAPVAPVLVKLLLPRRAAPLARGPNHWSRSPLGPESPPCRAAAASPSSNCRSSAEVLPAAAELRDLRVALERGRRDGVDAVQMERLRLVDFLGWSSAAY